MSTVPRVRAQPPATESLAGTGRRLLALLVDQLVALLLAAGASSIGYGLALDAVRGSATGEVAPEVGAILALPLVVLAVVGIAQWVAEAFTGYTLGGLALGARTVDADTGLTVGLVRIFVRDVVLGAGVLVCGVGQFVIGASGAWDSTGRLQGWHDKVARTVVVRTRGGGAAARAPRSEPGRRASGAVARTTPAPEAPRRAAGPGGAEALMRAARAGAAPAPSAPARSTAGPADGSGGAAAPARDPQAGEPGAAEPRVAEAPVTATVPGLVRTRPSQDADPLAGAREEDPTPPSGTARGRLVREPALPTSEPTPTLAVPTWSTDRPVDPAPAAAAAEVITGAPSWDDPLAWSGAAHPGAAAQAGVADAAPLDVQAPTAPTRRLRATAPPADAPDAPGADGRAAPEGSAPARHTPASVPAAPGGVRLVFDTGEAFTVAGRGVVGRNPSTADSGVVAHVVPIDDPARSVSKTHLEFGAEDGAFWVLDRRSTNGSALVHADGTRERLTAGVRTAVPVGAVVEFGDRRFRVLGA